MRTTVARANVVCFTVPQMRTSHLLFLGLLLVAFGVALLSAPASAQASDDPAAAADTDESVDASPPAAAPSSSAPAAHDDDNAPDAEDVANKPTEGASNADVDSTNDDLEPTPAADPRPSMQDAFSKHDREQKRRRGHLRRRVVRPTANKAGAATSAPSASTKTSSKAKAQPDRTPTVKVDAMNVSPADSNDTSEPGAPASTSLGGWNDAALLRAAVVGGGVWMTTFVVAAAARLAFEPFYLSMGGGLPDRGHADAVAIAFRGGAVTLGAGATAAVGAAVLVGDGALSTGVWTTAVTAAGSAVGGLVGWLIAVVWSQPLTNNGSELTAAGRETWERYGFSIGVGWGGTVAAVATASWLTYSNAIDAIAEQE